MVTDHRRLLQAFHVLVLIASSQISRTSALPRRLNAVVTVEAYDPDCDPEDRPPQPPIWPSVAGIEYTNLPAPTAVTEISWNPSAYQIPDGQVQVSMDVTVETVAVTSPSTTFLSSSEVTRYYTYTPLPRQFTWGWSSTSTSTIFVTASPAPTAGSSAATSSNSAGTSNSAASPTPIQSFTTSVPEVALTSLTTSEVQTVTAPAPSNTTGVSGPIWWSCSDTQDR